LSDRARQPGARSDIADILRAFDCFVLPSLSEATSCALQEAMATGLAIVATDVGGNADVLDHGQCGSLVPSGNATALATELQRLSQSGQPNAQAQEALISVQRRYGLATVIQRYSDLFLNAPAQGPREVFAQQAAPPQDTMR
jgi:glycosyltransferase involved in cell wall biosynthesis